MSLHRRIFFFRFSTCFCTLFSSFFLFPYLPRPVLSFYVCVCVFLSLSIYFFSHLCCCSICACECSFDYLRKKTASLSCQSHYIHRHMHYIFFVLQFFLSSSFISLFFAGLFLALCLFNTYALHQQQKKKFCSKNNERN